MLRLNSVPSEAKEHRNRASGFIEDDAGECGTSQAPVSLEEVVITRELLSRRVRKVKARAEIAGMHALAELMPKGVSIVLKKLAQLAIELCDAGTGGISMIETVNDGRQIFRWQALAGELERHEGGTTPRDWSPCGEALKSGTPMLYSYPARFFTYFQKVPATIVEGLVIPMYDDGLPIGTIWIVSHNEQRTFDAEDVRVMSSLGSFVTAAIRLSRCRGTQSAREAEREVVWREFLRRVALGDAAALEALIYETKPVVFARALNCVSFRADAEEITSDVYSQIWKNAGHYDPQRGSVFGWLMSITSSRALDRLRSRSRQEQRSEVSLSFECSSGITPESHALCSETTRHLRRVLQALPLEQRRAIELAYFYGYSMTEIAALLGHPLGTVKTRIRLGLIGLRRLLATMECQIPTKPPITSAHLGVKYEARQLRA